MRVGRWLHFRPRTRALRGVYVGVNLVILANVVGVPHVFSAELQNRSLVMSDNAAAANNVTYQASFTVASSGTIGSIELAFCSNDPFVEDPCTAPSGFNALAAQLTSQSGETGFSIAGNSTVNDLILTRAPVTASAVPVSYTFTHMTNPGTTGSYFLRILTYASTDASGVPTDTAGLAFSIANNVSLTATVPPFLLLCVGTAITDYDCSTATGSYIDFGDFSADTTSAGNTQIVVATNAQNGYNMWVTGTTLTSGNNTIPPMTATGASATGTSQFGLNLVANTLPEEGANEQGPGSGHVLAPYNQANKFRFVPGEKIISAPGPDDYRKYIVSYIVNVARNQSPGVYTSTLTYLATATF